MKIKIVMEAEVTDLKSYFPDDPLGVTVQNVGSLLRDTLVSEQLMKALLNFKEPNDKVREALDQIYRDNAKLGQRLTNNMKISLEE
jgi:hypothetical protein